MNKFSILLIWFFAQTAWSYSLVEIKQMAIDRSSMLSAMEFEQKALEFEQHLKAKWQNPQFVSQIGTLKSGPVQGSTVELTLTQPVPLSNKYTLRENLAKEIAEINQVDREKKMNWVGHQAILSAFKAQVYTELEKHALERKRRFGLIKKYLEVRPKITSKQMIEAALISGQILIMENTLSLKRMEADVALAEIEFWTGKKIKMEELDFVIPKSTDIKIPKDIHTDSDPEMKMSKLELSSGKIDLNLAKIEKRPDLWLGGGYRVEHVEPVNHFSYGVIGLTIPLWDTGNSRVEIAKARTMREEKMNEETQKTISLKHQKQLLMTEHAYDLFHRFPIELVAKQEHIFNVAEIGFKQGVVDANLYLQSEAQCHELIDNVYLNFLNFMENLSAYQLMRGEELSWNHY